MRKILFYIVCGILGLCLSGVVNIGLEPPKGITYNCDGQDKEIIKEYLSYNDEYVLHQLGQYQTTINVKDEVISQEGNKCEGYIVMSKKIITIDLEKGRIENVINHEIGHYIDYEYKNYTLSSEEDFCELWRKERLFFDPYFAGSNCECFAQSYKYYIEENEDFKRECPGLWEYMDKLLKG